MRDDVYDVPKQAETGTPLEAYPLELKPYGAAEIFLSSGDDTILVKNRLRGMVDIQTEPDGFIRKMGIKAGRRLATDQIIISNYAALNAGITV